MNFAVNNQEKFQTNSAVTMLIQGISTIFINQLPNFHAFRKVCNMLALKYSTTNHVDSKFD